MLVKDGPPDSDTFVERVFGFALSQLPSPPDAAHPRRKYVIAVLTEYLHSLQTHGLPLHLGASAMLFRLLEEQGSYYQLQLLVQYHLIPDSMDLAYRLLALESAFPPAAELAADMFKRLGPLGGEALMGDLLQRDQLLPACRFIRSHGHSHGLRSYPARPLLAKAAARKDGVFAAVFNFFRQRNEAWHNSIHFRPDEQCDEFVDLWQRSYGDQVEVDHGEPPPAAAATPTATPTATTPTAATPPASTQPGEANADTREEASMVSAEGADVDLSSVPVRQAESASQLQGQGDAPEAQEPPPG